MNGRKIEVPGTRGSVFKYRCNAPFKLFGHHGSIGCQGNNKWSLEHIPVCTSKYWLHNKMNNSHLTCIKSRGETNNLYIDHISNLLPRTRV